jgi:hypothetical protein
MNRQTKPISSTVGLGQAAARPWDVVVVGAGPSGSLATCEAARLKLHPRHSMSSKEATKLAQTICCETDRQRRVTEAIYRRSGVKNQYTCVPHEMALDYRSASWDVTGQLTVSASPKDWAFGPGLVAEAAIFV